MQKHIGYIKATTSYGGDMYDAYKEYYTDACRDVFETWLATRPKVGGIFLYRGYCFDSRYWEDSHVEEGRVIDVDSLTQSVELPAFTDDYIRAVRYINEFGETGLSEIVKVLFEVCLHDRYFVDISEYSVYQEEREYRPVRGMRLYVDKVQKLGNMIKVICSETGV